MNSTDKQSIETFIAKVGRARAHQGKIAIWEAKSKRSNDVWRQITVGEPPDCVAVSWLEGTASIEEIRTALRTA